MDSITKGLASSTLGSGHKRTIHQNVPRDSVKKGPQAIMRTADLHDGIKISRRFGEGSKPIFARDDITVNQSTVGDKHDVLGHDAVSSAGGCKYKTHRSSFSTESSSPERYRHRDNKRNVSPSPSRRKSSERSTLNDRYTSNRDKHSHTAPKTDRYGRKENSKSRSPFPVRESLTEKAPYFRDPARERERLRRLYGLRDRDRLRSRTPPLSKKHSPVYKRRIESPKRRRSTSRDKHHRRSPYRSSRRDYRSRKSRSRTRSPQRREHVSHKHSSRSSRESDKKDVPVAAPAALITPTPQFIPIPVVVPTDFGGYSLPGWPTTQPPTWPPSQHRPPPQYPPFHMLQMLPPIRPPPPNGYGGLPPNLYMAPFRPQMFFPQRPNLNCYQQNSYQQNSKRPLKNI